MSEPDASRDKWVDVWTRLKLGFRHCLQFYSYGKSPHPDTIGNDQRAKNHSDRGLVRVPLPLIESLPAY